MKKLKKTIKIHISDKEYDYILDYVYDLWRDNDHIINNKKITLSDAYEECGISFVRGPYIRYIEIDEEVYSFILLGFNVRN